MPIQLLSKSLVLFLVIFTTCMAHAGGIFPTRFYTPMTVEPPTEGAKVLYFGGPVISHVMVYQVFWGKNVDPVTVDGIGNFYKAVTNSTYMDWLQVYNTKTTSQNGQAGTQQDIGRGMLMGQVTITPQNTGTLLDKKDVEKELVHQFDIGALPRPDADSLYMIDFPPGITLSTGGINSCSAWCGDHEGFHDNTYGNVYYAMIPDLGGGCAVGCAFAGTMFESLTVIASHELIEAVTDPLCPDIGQNGAFPAAWLAADQNEVGDLCVNSSATLQTPTKSYALQGEWDNSINGCRGGTFH